MAHGLAAGNYEARFSWLSGAKSPIISPELTLAAQRLRMNNGLHTHDAERTADQDGAGCSEHAAAEVASNPHGYFATTHWSVLLEAGREDSERRAAALEELCQTYWQPVYALIRHSGHDVHDAEDLTQSFFAQLLARDA